MSFLHQLAEKVRRGEPIPFSVAAILSAATPLVRLGMWKRLREPRVRVCARVISFGNITAGGTGKTPAVIERARAEMAGGRKVAVLTRGYGSANPGELRIIEGGPNARAMVDVVGDEAALIAMKLPGAIVVRCKDRVAGARAAVEQHGCDTLILDDGYQYVRLERDENICVIDATNPFGDRRLVPRGILREPLAALRRATHIILTRCDQCPDLAPLLQQLKNLCPGVPVRKTRHAPTSLWRVADGSEMSLPDIRGQTVSALCAIGNPDGFRR
ncbi:MAG: tetraacyldisaccharide 4'-kinase, partial [Candidatus Hydrogenedentes bacterium]|nr:tetraacyldisaccharide 4'-kinase [Candidatus Hydrogenedentota bacterium]